MALGIDIYRYQTVTDWNAVRRHGVSFVYVKGSDGGGPAIVRADTQVRGAQGIGLPVGLYHYAQLSPSPEAQANVLTREVRRLGATGLPPALDLEEPHKPGAVARDFAERFIAQLRRNGFQRVTLYANTSMLSGLDGPEIDGDPDVVIWAASYGRNDGQRHPLSYRGRVHIHQYTSVGLVPGINGRVDLNESLTEIGGDDMATGDDVWNTLIQVRGQDAKIPARDMLMHNNFADWEAVNRLEMVLAVLGTMGNQLTDGQAAVMAAISERPTRVDLTTEQMQQLLAGLSAASKSGLRELLREGTEHQEGPTA